jgi:DNA polymerase-3 subunit gamma/tau
MLGTIDRDVVFRLLEALAGGDAAAVLAAAGEADTFAPDYAALLADLLSLLQRTALAQVLPDAIDDSYGDREAVLRLAGAMLPEDVQLFYQIGLLGRRDLDLAPDTRGGFEMVLLRMLAFRPVGAGQETASGPAPERVAAAGLAPGPTAAPTAPAAGTQTAAWREIIEALGLSGLTRELALNCALVEETADAVTLCLDPAHVHLLNKARAGQIEAALRRYRGRDLRLKVTEQGEAAAESPARQQAREADDRRQRAIESIEADENIKALQDAFGATVSYDSIRPRN